MLGIPSKDITERAKRMLLDGLAWFMTHTKMEAVTLIQPPPAPQGKFELGPSNTLLVRTSIVFQGTKDDVVLPLTMQFSAIKAQICRKYAVDPNYMAIFVGCDSLDDGDCWCNCSSLVPYRGDSKSNRTCLPPEVELDLVELSSINVTINYRGSLTVVCVYQYDYLSSVIQIAADQLGLPSQDPDQYHLSRNGQNLNNSSTIYGYSINDGEQLMMIDGYVEPTSEGKTLVIMYQGKQHMITVPLTITGFQLTEQFLRQFNIRQSDYVLKYNNTALDLTQPLENEIGSGTFIPVLVYEVRNAGGR